MHWNLEIISFYFFALLAISGSVLLINLNKVMHMAIALCLVFISVAGLFFLLNSPFLGVIQLLIYSGAISVLMLFGIMLTSHEEEANLNSSKKHIVFSLFGSGVFLVLLLFAINSMPYKGVDKFNVNDVLDLGRRVLAEHLIAFELASILLLVALVGSVVLARKEEV